MLFLSVFELQRGNVIIIAVIGTVVSQYNCFPAVSPLILFPDFYEVFITFVICINYLV